MDFDKIPTPECDALAAIVIAPNESAIAVKQQLLLHYGRLERRLHLAVEALRRFLVLRTDSRDFAALFTSACFHAERALKSADPQVSSPAMASADSGRNGLIYKTDPAGSAPLASHISVELAMDREQVSSAPERKENTNGLPDGLRNESLGAQEAQTLSAIEGDNYEAWSKADLISTLKVIKRGRDALREALRQAPERLEVARRLRSYEQCSINTQLHDLLWQAAALLDPQEGR